MLVLRVLVELHRCRFAACLSNRNWQNRSSLQATSYPPPPSFLILPRTVYDSFHTSSCYCISFSLPLILSPPLIQPPLPHISQSSPSPTSTNLSPFFLHLIHPLFQTSRFPFLPIFPLFHLHPLILSPSLPASLLPSFPCSLPFFLPLSFPPSSLPPSLAPSLPSSLPPFLHPSELKHTRDPKGGKTQKARRDLPLICVWLVDKVAKVFWTNRSAKVSKTWWVDKVAKVFWTNHRAK